MRVSSDVPVAVVVALVDAVVIDSDCWLTVSARLTLNAASINYIRHARIVNERPL